MKQKGDIKKTQGSLYQDLLEYVPAVLRKIKCTNSPMILITFENKKWLDCSVHVFVLVVYEMDALVVKCAT